MLASGTALSLDIASVSTLKNSALNPGCDCLGANLRVADQLLAGVSPLDSALVFDELQIDRRTLLEYIGLVVFTPGLVNSQEASGMWGMIAKITLLPGRRDEMIDILKESAADLPGCVSYTVAKDAADENTLWVTEVWDSMASHDASLSLPRVKNAIPLGKAIVLNFERIAVTNPVWGAGWDRLHLS
jgi:quinol monooxygenase YgiN